MVDNSDLNEALRSITAKPKMSLDEAIEHAKEKSNSECGECAEQHKQLAEWLVELRRYKKATGEIIVLCVCYFLFSFIMGAGFAKWFL